MLLSIVTLNYKKSALTITCMESLYGQFKEQFETNEMELLIVDNDSQDDSVPLLTQEIKEKNYKNVHLIANPNNSGFGAGCNIGAAKAKGTYIVFLNNDTLVKDYGILAMAKYLEDHTEIAILGGQLRNFDGSLQPSAGDFYLLGNAFLLLAGGQRFGLVDQSPKTIQAVDWVKGGLMMVRKSDFDELHGFDEKIFMYTEDMELCYRAHKAGKRVYFYPNVLVLHKDQGSSNKTFAIVNIYKNLPYFYKKHRSRAEYVLLMSMLRAKAKSLIVLGKSTKNQYLIDTYEKALAAL